MRCYFMRKGRIVDAEYLQPGSDENLIEQGKALFLNRPDELIDGFEVWHEARRLHIHPAVETVQRPADSATSEQNIDGRPPARFKLEEFVRKLMPLRRTR
jgi:hypothetical protein